MDFFDALSSRVACAKTSMVFESLDDQNNAPIVSLTRAQTHYRIVLAFFPKRFQNAVKRKIVST